MFRSVGSCKTGTRSARSGAAAFLRMFATFAVPLAAPQPVVIAGHDNPWRRTNSSLRGRRLRRKAMGGEWCRGRESNPHDSFESQDFKSCASASFATPALMISLGFYVGLVVAQDRLSLLFVPTLPACRVLPRRSSAGWGGVGVNVTGNVGTFTGIRWTTQITSANIGVPMLLTAFTGVQMNADGIRVLPVQVPEPPTLIVIAVGLLAFGLARRLRAALGV